jgi:hypothetical protein
MKQYVVFLVFYSDRGDIVRTLSERVQLNEAFVTQEFLIEQMRFFVGINELERGECWVDAQIAEVTTQAMYRGHPDIDEDKRVDTELKGLIG